MFRSIKLTALLMTMLLLVSLLAGCGGGNSSNSTNSTTNSGNSSTNQQSVTNSQGPEPITLPIVKQPLTLTYFVTLDAKMGATMKNYNEMTCYKEMEKRTGIHIDFQHPPAGQETEQFNLMLASQNMADMIEWSWLTVPGGPMKAIQDKAIVPLNELVNKYAPNLKKIIDNDPQVRKEITTDDGTMYVFPALYLDQHIKMTQGFQIRQDWLNKVGLQIPKTINEWYTVLKTFKENDPNGNGKADELPFVAQGIGDLSKWLWAWGMPYDFYKDDNGKVKYGPYQPEYKDFLTTMNKWYNEGLIDPDYAATDAKQFDAKVTGNLGGAWSGLLSGRLGRFVQLMKAQDPNVKLTGAYFPMSSTVTKSYNFNTDPARKYTGNSSTAISTINKHPVESTKWLDYRYSDEGHMIMNFGVEGISYNMVDGFPKFVDSITNNPNGLSVDQALGQHAASAGMTSMVMDPRAWDQRMWMPEQKEAISRWQEGAIDRTLPPITPTPEESSKLASIMNEINTYRDEMFNKFIMGQEPLDNYDKYIATLKSLGIEDAIKIEQAALDRFNARK